MASDQIPLFDKPEKWSYSKVKSLILCPKEFNLRYLSKQESANVQGIDTWVGRILHSVVADYFRSKKANRNEPEDIWQIYSRRLPDKLEWSKNPLGAKRAERFLEAFVVSDLAAKYPVAIEAPCKALVAEVFFTGRIDLVCTTDPDSETFDLVELKLNDNEVVSGSTVDRYLQLLLYQKVAVNIYPSIGRLGLYFFESAQFSEIETSTELCNTAVDRLGELIIEAKGSHFPATVNRFCPTCGYSERCEEYQRSIVRK